MRFMVIVKADAFEADDFGPALPPEVRAQELRAQTAAKK